MNQLSVDRTLRFAFVVAFVSVPVAGFLIMRAARQERFEAYEAFRTALGSCDSISLKAGGYGEEFLQGEWVQVSLEKSPNEMRAATGPDGVPRRVREWLPVGCAEVIEGKLAGDDERVYQFVLYCGTGLRYWCQDAEYYVDLSDVALEGVLLDSLRHAQSPSLPQE